MNQQLVSQMTTMDAGIAPSTLDVAILPPRYVVEAVSRLNADQRSSLQELVRTRPFGELAIPWCEMLQATNLLGIDLYYLIISSGETTKGVAIFYILRRLDVAKYIKWSLSRWVERLAGWGIRPLSFNIGFLDIPFTNMAGVLGTPDVTDQERHRMMLSVVDYLRKKTDIHVLVTTADPTPESRASLGEEGFIQISAPANTMLATPFESFDEYLASLPRKVRWDIKDKIRRFEAAGGRIEQRIRLGEDTKRVYELFQKTSKAHEGQEVAWPVIPNLSLFANLEKLGDSHRMLLAYIGDRLIGFLMLAQSGETLFFKFCGLDYDLCREPMAYFNLFYVGIRYGIEHGCRQISLGPTSYFNKERLGAELRPIDLQINIFRGVLKLLRRVANLVI